MPRQRKLFMIHASELAHLLVRAVGSGGLVARFVAAYARTQDRPGLMGNAEQARELDSTIGREALLVMAVEVRRLLPRAVASGHSRGLSLEDTAFAETFYADFLAALARSLDWSAADTPAEKAAFSRDLQMYQKWSGRSAMRPPSGSTAAADLGRSPFADRCALLLDPSMMEQARRAAAAFESEVTRVGAAIFARLGRHGLIPRRRAKRRRSVRARPASRRRKAQPRRPKTKRGKAKTRGSKR